MKTLKAGCASADVIGTGSQRDSTRYPFALNRRRVLLAGGAVAVSPFLVCAAQAQSHEFKVLSAFPPNLAYTRELIKVYVDNLQKASGGAITARISGPEVVSFADQFQPVAAGAFDMLFTHGAYHSGTTGVGLAIDAIAPDIAKRRSSGLFDFMDHHYNTFGLKLLAVTSTGHKGYQFVMKQPIKGAPGLAGMKVRGTVSYHPMIKALGGSPVVMGGGEIYSALEKGVIDAAAWGLTGVNDLKWYEVAKYLARPTFGSSSFLIFMNLKAWNALPASEQKIFNDEAVKLEFSSAKRFDELADEELVELKKHGMQETEFAPADASRLEALWAQGVWEVALAKSPAAAEEMRALARKAGLTA
jgi:TRAP-type C4-dicarboxylate transport system substrate-binding protein